MWESQICPRDAASVGNCKSMAAVLKFLEGALTSLLTNQQSVNGKPRGKMDDSLPGRRGAFELLWYSAHSDGSSFDGANLLAFCWLQKVLLFFPSYCKLHGFFSFFWGCGGVAALNNFRRATQYFVSHPATYPAALWCLCPCRCLATGVGAELMAAGASGGPDICGPPRPSVGFTTLVLLFSEM